MSEESKMNKNNNNFDEMNYRMPFQDTRKHTKANSVNIINSSVIDN